MRTHILAAFIFFTRLPFWRLYQVPAESFKHVVPYWPYVGWLTGGFMAGSLWLFAQILPLSVAWLLAIVVRLLVTGALHEDGLADFCDGFGGGTNRPRILQIMKDSHIGTYGVIGLILYFLLLWQLQVLPLGILCLLILAGDAWCKCCVAQIVNFLPYARPEQESKARVVYSRMSKKEGIASCLGGLIPVILFIPQPFVWALWAPAIVFLLGVTFIKRKIQGYTGDCCGALFLFSEISFYLTCIALWKLY